MKAPIGLPKAPVNKTGAFAFLTFYFYKAGNEVG
jgi:hypothetical protein